MAKVFISQPMEGKTAEEIAKVREKAIKAATRYVHFLYGENEPVEIIDNLLDQPAEKNHMWREAQCIELLSTADVAYFPGEYYTAVGCRTEHDVANSYLTPYVITDNTDNSNESKPCSAYISKNF